MLFTQGVFSAVFAADNSDAQSVQNDISNLNVSLAEAVNRYDAEAVKLDDLNAKIDANQNAMDDSARALGKSLRILNNRAIGIYKRGNVSSLEVIFNSKNMGDLVQQLDLLSRIGDRDGVVVKQVEAQKKSIETTARDLAAQRKTQQQLTDNLASQRDGLNAQLGEKENVLASILSDLAEIDAAAADRAQRSHDSGARRSGASLTNPLPGGDWGQLAPGQESDHYKYGGSGHGVWLYEYSSTGDADAMDIGGAGDIVYAAHSGTVIYTTWDYSGVTIIQGDGFYTCYAHSGPFFSQGDSITEGQAIAEVSSGPDHLHFELLDGGQFVPAGDFQTYF